MSRSVSRNSTLKSKRKTTKPYVNVMTKMFESMSTHDSIDCHVVVDGDKVHMFAVREIKGSAHFAYSVSFLSGFKAHIEKKGHEFGLINLMIPTDRDKGAPELMVWLMAQARDKDFSFVTMIGNDTTKVLAERMKEYAMEMMPD